MEHWVELVIVLVIVPLLGWIARESTGVRGDVRELSVKQAATADEVRQLRDAKHMLGNSQHATEGRVGIHEVRIDHVERRVTALERGGGHSHARRGDYAPTEGE